MSTTFVRRRPGRKPETRQAHSPADAVRLRFDGFVEQPDDTTPADEPPTQPASKPQTTTTAAPPTPADASGEPSK